jgi:hypothetical protein
MASYGVFLAVCGFEYHGPRGHIGFAPRLKPDDFRAAFTAAEGWGTFTQQRQGHRQSCTIDMRYGQLRFTSLALAVAKEAAVLQVLVDGQVVPFQQQGERVLVHLDMPLTIQSGEQAKVELILREKQ